MRWKIYIRSIRKERKKFKILEKKNQKKEFVNEEYDDEIYLLFN